MALRKAGGNFLNLLQKEGVPSEKRGSSNPGGNYALKRVVLVHNVQSNDSQSNNAQFMHKLCLPLHATNRLMGTNNLHHIEKLNNIT